MAAAPKGAAAFLCKEKDQAGLGKKRGRDGIAAAAEVFVPKV